MKIKYDTATGMVEIEVDDKWGAIITEMDRKESNLARKERRHCVHLDITMDHAKCLGTVENDPQEMYKETESMRKLRHALEELTPKQRRLVEKLFYEGLTQSEIAKEEHISQSAVAQQWKTILKKLRKFF